MNEMQSTKSTEKPDLKIGHASTLRYREEKQKLFADAMAERGNVSAGCKAAGINRTTAYNWRKEDPAFKKVWDDALETCLDSLEDAVIQRGKKKSDRLAVFMLKSRRRRLYGDKVTIGLLPVTFMDEDDEDG